MKKRFAAVLTSLLLLMLLVPAAAFATGGHTVNGDLNLTSGTTLENDGYTWDAYPDDAGSDGNGDGEIAESGLSD